MQRTYLTLGLKEIKLLRSEESTRQFTVLCPDVELFTNF